MQIGNSGKLSARGGLFDAKPAHPIELRGDRRRVRLVRRRHGALARQAAKLACGDPKRWRKARLKCASLLKPSPKAV